MSSSVRYPCETTLTPAPPVVPSSTRARGPWILAATVLGSSMAFIDGTVVNVALPSLQAGLHATLSQVQWVVESYALLLAALLLAGGALGDLYGRRFIFCLGVSIFAAASVWCGLAPDIRQLILARAVQGVGGALLVPGSLAIISASFPTDQRGRAIGTWSAFTGITAAVGPVLGGWLVEHLSWRWVFFINLPIAALVLVICYWRVPESRDPNRGRLDLRGAMLITLGLGTLVYGLIESSNYGWRQPRVWGSLAAALLAFAAFLLVESRSRSSLMPLKLFRSHNFAGANLLTLFLYAALGTILFFLPFNLIQVQGYTPTQAGAANLPFILIMFFLSRWAGGLIARYGARLPLAVGSLITAAGFALFARPGLGGNYWTTFFPAMIVLGLGMACVVAPLTTTVMDSVDQSQAGTASGINNSISRIASLLAIAVCGVILLQVFAAGLKRTLADSSLPAAERQAIYQQRNRLIQIQLPGSLDEQQKKQARLAIDESFVAAFRAVMLLSALLSGVSAVVAWMTLDRSSESTPRRASGPG
ncbi:MAG TPA: MFS transporter [Candidatus Angelobacter sp.]